MTDSKKLADMEDRTVPMPVTTASQPKSAEPEPTQNREPMVYDPPREGSAIYPVPAAEVGASFDDEIERHRAPPARPARGHTAVLGVAPAPEPGQAPDRQAAVSTGPSPAEVFASKASFGRVNDAITQPPPEAEPTQAVPPNAEVTEGAVPERPREPQPVGLPLSAWPSEGELEVRPVEPDEQTEAAAQLPEPPTAARSEELIEIAITAPYSVAALRANTVPQGTPAAHTTTEEEPAPITSDAKVPSDAAARTTLELPLAAVAPGTPTLELPASTVAPDDPTLLKPDRPRGRSRAPLFAAIAVLAGVAGVAGGLVVRSQWSKGTAAPNDAAAVAPPSIAAAVDATAPRPAPLAAPPPIEPAPAIAAAASVPATAPPAASPPAASPLAASPPAASPLAASPPTAPPPAAPPPKPIRSADGFGPFVDRSGAGLGAALGAGVRAVLGDALQGTTIGVRGELRRASARAGVANAECGVLIFDDAGQRAAVRGAARVEEPKLTSEQLLRRAAEACARAIEGELRAAVEHAKSQR